MRKEERFILASGSPRRREILSMLDIAFEVMVPAGEEILSVSDPAGATEELSKMKAREVAEQVKDGIVLGADTVVAADGQILGKPSGKEEAEKMTAFLQGRTHTVCTGVTLIRKKKGKVTAVHTFSVETRVRVAPMTLEEIKSYAESGDGLDKAGAYGIQGRFSRHISGIDGDYYNVVGLPLQRLYEELKKPDFQ